MTYILLVTIIFLGGDAKLYHVGEFQSMVDCFNRREQIVEQIGRPVINYQVICIPQADSI